MLTSLLDTVQPPICRDNECKAPSEKEGGDRPSEARSVQSPLFQLLLLHFYGCSIAARRSLAAAFHNGAKLYKFRGRVKNFDSKLDALLVEQSLYSPLKPY